MDSARGGGALVGVARIVSTLFATTAEEALIYGVTEAKSDINICGSTNAKANLTLVTFAARWFTKKTVTLPNGDDDEPPGRSWRIAYHGHRRRSSPASPITMVNAMLDAIEAGTPARTASRAASPTPRVAARQLAPAAMLVAGDATLRQRVVEMHRI